MIHYTQLEKSIIHGERLVSKHKKINAHTFSDARHKFKDQFTDTKIVKVIEL